MAKKAEEYEKRRKLRLEMMERKTNEMSRKVATNRRSEFLAGDREHSSTLHRPIGNVRNESHRIIVSLQHTHTQVRPSTISEMSKECTLVFYHSRLCHKKLQTSKHHHTGTFSPALNKPKHKKKLPQKKNIAEKVKVDGKVFERNQKWLEKRQLKRQQKRSEKLKSSAEKCTFRPRINRSSKTKTAKTSIAERSREWLQAKQVKQQKKRSEKENEALRECTFRPNRIGGLAKTVIKSRNNKRVEEEEESVWNYYETDDGYVYSHNPKTGETRWAEEHEVMKIHESPSSSNGSTTTSPMEPESLDQAFRRVC